MAADTLILENEVAIGPFQLNPARRSVSRNGAPVRIGSRALEILIALAERPGEVVSKRDLVARVWPNITVDESGLRVHMTGLRRALGDRQDGAWYVSNVPGRGYCLLVPAERRSLTHDLGFESGDCAPILPKPLKQMIGRDAAVCDVTAQLLVQRFVSIAGPGGIGKTTVAVAAAHALTAEFRGAVAFVDFLPSAIPNYW